MRARATLLAAALPLVLGAAPPQELRRATRAAAAADARATALERQADAAGDANTRAALRQRAITARIAAAEAAIGAAEVRSQATATALAEARARIAARQQPLERLVAAIQALARRPALAAVAQPGTIDDAVHVRALLGTMLPVVRARTAALRGELDRLQDARRNAAAAAVSLRAGRESLEAGRLALVRLEGEQALRGAGSARFESDRALALGEAARDFAATMRSTAAAADVRDALGRLDGPLPRPGAGDDAPRFGTAPYRLPVRGRIVAGLGELSDSGVRSRGLTLAVDSAAPVVAPAAGRIVFARGFRDYGGVVIIDHGGGWSSAVTGLAALAAKPGDVVRPGDLLGRAAPGDARVTVELRRRGIAVDLAQLLS